MRRLLRCALVLFWVAAWPASAAELKVSVTDSHGHAVADTVVALTPDVPPARPPAPPPPATYYIDQRDETFVPYVQVFRPGDRVVFRNSDTTRHHVYSFSTVKTFEFVLRSGESSPPLVLDKTGIAAVGCNIHDHMITYLFVSAAPAIAMSDAAGQATLGHLAAGAYTIHVWHPQLYPGRPPVVGHVLIGKPDDVQKAAFALTLMPDPRMRMDREHMDY